MIPVERLAQVFVEVADTLVNDFDINVFIDRLATDAAALMSVDAVGVLLVNSDGALSYMGASTEDAKALEEFQLAANEGPCIDCYRTGQPVIEPDLRSNSSRWPLFIPVALAASVRAVHAFPLRLRDRTIGGLNVFGREPHDIAESDVPLVQALADLATIAIIQAEATAAAESLVSQLQAALDRSRVIEQAKGALSRAHGVTPQQAWEMMRTTARAQQVRVADIAEAIIRGAADDFGIFYI